MLTIFTVPKPFAGSDAVHQRNALASWQVLPLEKCIVLLGDEPGVPEAAAELKVDSVPELARDEHGTPLLDRAFAIMRSRVGEGDTMCYVNADIVLLPDLVPAIQTAAGSFESYLLISRRWNLELDELLDFAPGWDERLRRRVLAEGELFIPHGIDIFVFRGEPFGDIPPFSIGRSYWDMWLVFEARRRGIPVVDATTACTIVHQNHRYAGFSSIDDIRQSVQGQRNFELAGGTHFGLGRTTDASHVLTPDGLRPAPRPRVSVVIPHRGDRHVLAWCLRALTWQDYPHSFVEVVVVCNDDGGWIDAIREEFPFVRIEREARRGPAAARNTGVRQSSGELIAFLDSDCAPETAWLEQGLSTLRGQGPLAVVAGDIQRTYRERAARSAIEAYDAVTFLQQERYVGAQRAVTANLFVSRELFERVGSFDESFDGGAGEDWDWTERAVARGAVISFCAGARVRHPALRSWSSLRQKVERIEAGNMRRRDKGARDAAHPDRTGLVRRVQRLASDPRLSRRERIAAVGIHCVVWWWGLRAWQRGPRPAEPGRRH